MRAHVNTLPDARRREILRLTLFAQMSCGLGSSPTRRIGVWGTQQATSHTQNRRVGHPANHLPHAESACGAPGTQQPPLPIFCKCSLQATLSLIILQVFIVSGLVILVRRRTLDADFGSRLIFPI